MATTVGPEPFMFDNNPDRLGASMGSLAASSLGSESSPRGGEIPPPNPPFVFPAMPPSPASAPINFSRTTTRRPMSAIESPNRSFGLSDENDDRLSRSALPQFSFNPGASLPTDPQASFLLSPPVSPASIRNGASAARPMGHGHRRGGSEFVGGRLREGNSIAVMSTSPTKSESGFNTPTLQPPRRSHRRGISGAISTNDLPILQPPVFDSSLGRGSSAPTSPTTFGQAQDSVMSSCLDLPALPEPETIANLEPEGTPLPVERSSLEGSPKQNKTGSKARVGFSDTLEFIPRPLSLVSNETSSTVTARPGHSLSGSISSIVSAASPSGRGSPAPMEPIEPIEPIESIPLSRSSTRDPTDSRPSTAGAILERAPDVSALNSSPRRRNSIPTLIHLAEAIRAGQPEPSPTRTPKRWSFFARDPSTASSSPTKARPHSSSSSGSVAKGSSSEHGSDTPVEIPIVAPVKQKKTGKKNKKKKKVKGWAGSILPKKPKGHSKKSKSDVVRLPSRPSSIVQPENDDDDFLMDDPELLEPSMPTATVTESPDLPEQKGKRSEESFYPMIDLDAALGPFNTPLPMNPEWEAAQRAAGNAGKRRLHSAQGMKGFSGPGMHYHRRAESAPDLPPFDPGRSSMHRFNSSSTMADVFEEDEEDEHGNSKSRSPFPDSDSESESESDSDATPPAALAKDPLLDVQDQMSTHSSAQSMRRTNSSLSDKEPSTVGSVRAERSKSSLHDSIIVEEMPSVIFRSANMFADRVDASDMPTPSLRRFSGNKDMVPVDISPIHLPTPNNVPISPYAISHSSSFPSPRSPMSVEVQHISTAPSSVTDENNFQSLLLMGEPGPEVRISVDYDIPSLTSSNSTMTRDSMFTPGYRMSQPTLREPRPVSVSSTAFGRRRSSLASLSRLISSSHGERSKLSMEVTLDSEPSKKSKNSRTKRLSRMMQFWKPSKENTTN
ncbi:hypothetical protein AK830_g8871 [Neonectria ditissima]|uniref:Cell wall proline rich protein n=1 Tax=Neonectria ditissima TaxID=78410 RepID=A0A0N8H613_9HYPO|nr:hypothetical protein AK830_g8871 [Neonectria ditissima]